VHYKDDSVRNAICNRQSGTLPDFTRDGTDDKLITNGVQGSLSRSLIRDVVADETSTFVRVGAHDIRLHEVNHGFFGVKNSMELTIFATLPSNIRAVALPKAVFPSSTGTNLIAGTAPEFV